MPSVDKSSTRIQRMFGEIAPRYDFLNHLLSFGIDRRWRRRATQQVPPGEGPVLDVCTGTGDFALAYWRAGGRNIRVVGTDFAHPMLVIARRKAQRLAAAGQVSFLEADTQNLPFPDDAFQIVTVAFGLRNISDTERGLREMVRVCRPGGKVAVLEFSMPRSWPIRSLYRGYFHYVLPHVGQILARNRQSAYNYLPASVGEFPQDEALVERMLRAGLHDARFFPFTFGIATLYVGVK
jgi:demethylmenaquinone methyltransferase / 2-methoxy-6-polyprenyl-1,4-benzoquinol methylase